MSDFTLVDPGGWEYDLQSVYSAYMSHFQLHNVLWYEKTWGHLFETFDLFLGCSWPVIIVTDIWTSKAHIVTKLSHIQSFIKMIRTRFGETLPLLDNFLRIAPYETSTRPLRTISDMLTYRKAHSTLSGAALVSLKTRIKAGEPKFIQQLWNGREKTFLAINFEWSERNTSSCLEWGYAAVRCNHLDVLGIWPPDPNDNYRRGHYVVQEYARVQNKHRPTFPWEYAFGSTQVVPKVKLPLIIQAVISSLSSPDSDTKANDLVIVSHGAHGDMKRMAEMGIKLPSNVHVIDTASFERELFSGGHRGPMVDSQGKPRAPRTTISLPAALASLGVDARWSFHNSGNDAFSSLLILQMLIDRDNTKQPTPAIPHRGRNGETNPPRTRSWSPGPLILPTHNSLPTIPMSASSPSWATGGNHLSPNEFGSIRRSPGRPNTFYGGGTNNRSSSTGDLLNSMKNLRTS